MDGMPRKVGAATYGVSVFRYIAQPCLRSPTRPAPVFSRNCVSEEFGLPFFYQVLASGLILDGCEWPFAKVPHQWHLSVRVPLMITSKEPANGLLDTRRRVTCPGIASRH